MDDQPQPPLQEAEEEWRQVLSGEHPGYRFGRRVFSHIPATPRCKLCAAPFAGAGAPFMRAIGKRPWPKNPKYCSSCFSGLTKHQGGAEVELSLLFADVRGSTALGESLSPRDFRALMDRFYHVATDVVIDNEGYVDKFVGDEVIGVFIPMISGNRHAARAVAAARALLPAVTKIYSTPPLRIGIGVNTGLSYVGTVGAGDDLEFTALGDTVNTTARLASAAGPGELLVSDAAAAAAGLDTSALERRALELKGKSDKFTVVVLTETER